MYKGAHQNTVVDFGSLSSCFSEESSIDSLVAFLGNINTLSIVFILSSLCLDKA